MREVNVLKHLPVVVLALLLLAGATLWLLFVQEQQFRVRMAFQTQLERLSDELLRGRLEGRLGPDSLPEGVRAFAVYGPRGESVASWGVGAPEKIDLPTRPPRGPLNRIIDQDGSWVGFLRVLQPLRPRLALWNEEEPPPVPGPGRRGQGFTFLSVSDASLQARLWAWTLGGAAGTAAWAGFVAFVAILWYRTRSYQAALSHHRELLQFAEASRTLGHELQNPLAAILLQTALLKRGANGSLAPEVAIIEEEAQRISALVVRVRDFLKDPKGQTEVLDLAELAETLSDRFATPVTLALDGRPFLVRFEPHRLRSVVENLIKNAAESGPNSAPALKLSRPRSGWVRLEVVDSGSGFTPAALKQALQPFYTTKTTGSGIGLSIADGFIRAAGGRLRLENRTEGGARVLFDLPEASERPA